MLELPPLAEAIEVIATEYFQRVLHRAFWDRLSLADAQVDCLPWLKAQPEQAAYWKLKAAWYRAFADGVNVTYEDFVNEWEKTGNE